MVYRVCVHCIVYLVQCTAYSVRRTLYTVYSESVWSPVCCRYSVVRYALSFRFNACNGTLSTLHCTVYAVCRTLYIVHRIVYIIHGAVYSGVYIYISYIIWCEVFLFTKKEGESHFTLIRCNDYSSTWLCVCWHTFIVYCTLYTVQCTVYSSVLLTWMWLCEYWHTYIV